MTAKPEQVGFDTHGRKFDLRAFADEIAPRRALYANMDDEEAKRHRGAQPRKTVEVMDEVITKLSRSVQLDERGDGSAAERIRREVQHDLKVVVWHLMLSRLATQELDRRRAAAA